MAQPSLHPQDVVVLAKLLSTNGRRAPMAQIGLDLSMSASEIHAALKRLAASRLISNDAGEGRPRQASSEEFLIHGVKYAFPAKRGEITRGVPTAYAAPPLNKHFRPGADLPPVWPYAEGQHRGVSVEPLHRGVPAAALRDPILYELLALVDALRDGRARERQHAERALIARVRRQLHD